MQQRAHVWMQLDQTVYSVDGVLLYIATAFLGGAGIMYVFNIGAIVRSLQTTGEGMYVSWWSLSSCAGRLLTGAASDVAKNMYNISRIWFLIIAAVIMLCGQLLFVFFDNHTSTLASASVFIGFGYGSTLTVVPILISEWFGLLQLGYNW